MRAWRPCWRKSHRCQTDAEFLAQLGFLLNAQGRYTEALDHLERALMLNPGLKGAQIDYAVALAGIGDYASALTLVQDLLADPALPSGLVPVLQRQIENLSVSMNTGRLRLTSPCGFVERLVFRWGMPPTRSDRPIFHP
jgi:hypothetical protein